MNDRPVRVRQSHTFQLLCEAGQVGVAGKLEYRRDEPYAIAATFRVGSDAEVRWLFARDLLIEGLVGAAGEGDVRVMLDGIDPETVVIELRSPDGAALLTIPTADLARFLDATYAVVAVGDERLAVDIERELSALLTNDQ